MQKKYQNELALHLLYLEGLVISETIDDDEALAVLDVEVAHAGKLLGAGCIEDLEDAGRVIDLDLLPVKIFDRRVILLHEAT